MLRITCSVLVLWTFSDFVTHVTDNMRYNPKIRRIVLSWKPRLGLQCCATPWPGFLNDSITDQSFTMTDTDE